MSWFPVFVTLVVAAMACVVSFYLGLFRMYRRLRDICPEAMEMIEQRINNSAE